jgi:hypothetical protein
MPLDYPKGGPVTTPITTDHITDEYMHDRIGKAKAHTLTVLTPTNKYFKADSRSIVREHGRRNMALQAAGIMPIVRAVEDREISGIGIFNTDPRRAPAIDVHACRGLPGDALPS